MNKIHFIFGKLHLVVCSTCKIDSGKIIQKAQLTLGTTTFLKTRRQLCIKYNI